MVVNYVKLLLLLTDPNDPNDQDDSIAGSEQFGSIVVFSVHRVYLSNSIIKFSNANFQVEKRKEKQHCKNVYFFI